MMMIYAVYDVKAASYGTPAFLASKGIALRGFADVCANGQSQFAKHPGDFQMFELGSYDPNSGLITPHPQPIFCFSASEVVQQVAQAREAQASAAIESAARVKQPPMLPRPTMLTKRSKRRKK